MKKIIFLTMIILNITYFVNCSTESYEKFIGYYEKQGVISILSNRKVLSIHYDRNKKLTQKDLDNLFFLKTKIKYIYFSNKEYKNYNFEVIKELKNLRYVVIENTRINDNFLKLIEKHKKITMLEINSTPITDKGLSYLKGLENLKRLEIGGCSDITDEGMKYVGQLKNLEWLNIANTHITDKGIMYLKNPKLDTIIASYNEGLTDKGFEYIIHNFKLKVLEVVRTPNISRKKKDDYFNYAVDHDIEFSSVELPPENEW